MKRILILGGYGLTGKPLARHLLAETEVEIILAGRNLTQAQQFGEELNTTFPGERVSAARVDAASERDLQRALQDIDLILVAAPTVEHASTVIHTALKVGVDYLDVQYSLEKLDLLRAAAPEIEAAGRYFITEAGFHPGLPSAMVRYAGSHLDRLDRAHIACYLNMGRELPYSQSVDELMVAFRNYRGQIFKDGAWTKPNSYHLQPFDFGPEIGRRRCFSMFFDELHDLPQMIPGLQDLGFFIAETHWIVDWLITPIVFFGVKTAPDRAIRPLGKLMWWGMQTFARPPFKVNLKIEAEGMVQGHESRLEVSLSHRDGYELTAIPVVACLLQILDGTSRRPGLWMMGHLVDPSRLFSDMARMGIQVTTECI